MVTTCFNLWISRAPSSAAPDMSTDASTALVPSHAPATRIPLGASATESSPSVLSAVTPALRLGIEMKFSESCGAAAQQQAVLVSLWRGREMDTGIPKVVSFANKNHLKKILLFFIN